MRAIFLVIVAVIADGASIFGSGPRPQAAKSAVSVVPKETNLKQSYFFFNNITYVSQWNRPMEMALRDSQTGRPYWNIFGKVTWEPPTDLAWRTVPYNSSLNYYENWISKERTWTRPMPLAWSKRSVLNSFWVNVVTNQAQRTVPRVVGFTDEKGNRYYIDPETELPTWEKPVEASWVHRESEKYPDRNFFFNEASQESTWETPEDSNLAWVKMHDVIPDESEF